MTLKRNKILEKSVSDTLLERFGDPPGAKIPQERHQEQNLMKNVQFLGAPWGPKWSQNPKKKMYKNHNDFGTDTKTIFFALGSILVPKTPPK